MLLEAVGPTGTVIAIDRDPAALARVRARIDDPRLRTAQASFAAADEVLAACGVEKIDGLLLDLGLSSDQLSDHKRGFSFNSEGPLDLRFDVEEGRSAAELVHSLPEEELAGVLYRYGDERFSRRIARALVARRRASPIETAQELAKIVADCIPQRNAGRIHPATRTFQALRIAVNDELGALEQILRDAPDLLAPGGRAAIISFHSLEDRLVKGAFRGDKRWRPVTKKPITPGEEELAANPRARSAKLRVAERKTADALY